MGLCWLIVGFAVHLYAIVLFVTLLPFPTPRQWKSFFNVWPIKFFFGWLRHIDLSWVTYCVGCLAFFLFADCLKEYKKSYEVASQYMGQRYPTDDSKDAHIDLLKAERNYYISGSLLVLSLLFPQVITILQNNSNMQDKVDSLNVASKVFGELLRDLQFEREVERRGGVDLTILGAMRNEMEYLKNTGGGSRSGNDWKSILNLYERRKARLRDESSRLGGSSRYNSTQERLPRSRFSTTVPINSRPGWEYNRNSSLSHQRRYYDPADFY